VDESPIKPTRYKLAAVLGLSSIAISTIVLTAARILVGWENWPGSLWAIIGLEIGGATVTLCVLLSAFSTRSKSFAFPVTFTIRDLFWLMLVAALTMGWWRDHVVNDPMTHNWVVEHKKARQLEMELDTLKRRFEGAMEQIKDLQSSENPKQ